MNTKVTYSFTPAGLTPTAENTVTRSRIVSGTQFATSVNWPDTLFTPIACDAVIFSGFGNVVTLEATDEQTTGREYTA